MLLQAPKTRRWTKKEYHQAAELGWFDRQHVELINGEVVEMPPQKNEHAYAVRKVDRALRAVFGRGFTFLVQMPISPPGASEPEPDVAVVRGEVEDVKVHPSTAELVVEVSDTTLAYDRATKASLYAAAGIQEYWIINLVEATVEVRRGPIPQRSAEFGRTYSHTMTLRSGEKILPLSAKKKVAVKDLLP